MTEQSREHAILEAVRRSDAFSNAITALVDAKGAGYPQEPGPDYWPDIHKYAIPLLRAEMTKASAEVARLHEAS